jgi:aminoglycoside/choline kinase family phosphotransferase
MKGPMEQNCLSLSSFNLPDEFPRQYSLQRLTGDASSRSYFRIYLPSGETVVLMKMPEPFDENQFPYLDNYQLFRSLGIELARIYHMDPAKGFVFLQDLGDSTLFELYSGWREGIRLQYYLGSLDYMFKFKKGIPENGIAFNTEKFLWELNFFQEHFLKELRNCSITKEEAEALEGEFHKLAAELAEQPRVFCHRDYHSRNLMVQEGRLYVIDFQDARYGPATYDFASLVYDSYIQHSPEFVSYLEKYFFTHHPDAHLQRYEYPRMCLQRNLKALGTFGYQASKLGRDFYLQFVGPTLYYVRGHFAKLPEYREMSKLLARHLPELN